MLEIQSSSKIIFKDKRGDVPYLFINVLSFVSCFSTKGNVAAFGVEN